MRLGGDRDDEAKMRPLGWVLVQSEWCPDKKGSGDIRRTLAKGPCEDTAITWLPASPGERPQEKAALRTPSSWTSDLQNHEE